MVKFVALKLEDINPLGIVSPEENSAIALGSPLFLAK